MATPYRILDWNGLIDTVNGVLENPPSGCDPIAPIPHVSDPHRWAKLDVSGMQDKIKETCDTITFGAIPDLWKQSILDEINTKLAEAWCDCDCCDPLEATGDGAFTILASGDTELLASLDDMVGGDVQIGHVLTGSGFTNVEPGDPLATLVTQATPATGGPPVGSRSYSFNLSIQVFDTSTNRYRGTSLFDSVNCYGTPFDSGYFLALSGKFTPERVVTATSSLALRYTSWRLTVNWSYRDDICRECTADPFEQCLPEDVEE